MTSEFVISLDFELLWGMRDHADRTSYGANVLGAREAIPRILDLFAEYGVRATWATVGFLFCESRDELIAALPDLRPDYRDQRLSNYAYLDEVGSDEKADPYYFGASLVERIAQTPGQELNTHTMSHFYCLEPGATEAAFESDLSAAIILAQKRKMTLKSIVFHRNQYNNAHLAICKRCGITAYRGNPMAWAYRATSGSGQTLLRRALRLVDAYTGVLGAQTYFTQTGAFRNVPASMFLRPYAPRLAKFHSAHLRTVTAGMTHAASTGEAYHIWWHPHNFGQNLDVNLDGLTQILVYFRRLADEHGMRSRTMGEAGQ